MHENATTARADVVFPLESHAEKDGTVTHPDGRLQRVRPSASRPGDIRSNVLVLSMLAESLGLVTGIDSQPSAFGALTEAVSFYNGITDAEIGGRGIRWHETQAAANAPQTNPSIREAGISGRVITEGDFVLGTYRDLWAGSITELNPPLRFLQPRQRLEISLADAERLGLGNGDRVRVGRGGVEAEVQVKERVPEGIVFLAEGLAEGNANALLNGGPVRVDVHKLSEVGA
jgi:NADH-quinone oxidoreductase subunit G